MTVTILETDFIQSITDALQFISYYHPPDYIDNLARAYERERSPLARNAMGQILLNSRLCAEGHRPICQDTGIVNVFLKIGMDVRWRATRDIIEMVNVAVCQAYGDPRNKLRPSIVADGLFSRNNTQTNAPAVVHVDLVAGTQVEVTVAAKGAGSENKARFTTLEPFESAADWIVEVVPGMGAGWCPPGILGIGIGGTAEKAMLMAKESLMDPIDMHDLIARGPSSKLEEFRIDLYRRVNALGIGAQGLGGLTTVLDVKVRTYPSHAASKPVAMIPNCAAMRHATFVLDGSGPVELHPPALSSWPVIDQHPLPASRSIDLNTLRRDEVRTWRAGDALLLSGKLLTGRDAAHKRIVDLLASGQPMPPGLSFRERVIYYVGPVDPVRDEVVGPAGPTTASRMDRYTDTMLEKAGLIAMIGKGERGPDCIEALKRHGAAYLIAVGGAAYLISKAIRAARLLAFPELGMEAIYEFDVKDLPVIVAVDATGTSVHTEGPKQWRLQAQLNQL